MPNVITGQIVPQGPRSNSDLAAMAFLARFENDNTRLGYQRTIAMFYWFAQTFGFDPLEADRARIEMFLRYLEKDRGNGPATVLNRLNALSGLFKFAHLDGLIDKNPMLHVKRPHVPYETTTQALSRTEFADMLKLAEDTNPMWHALLCILGLNGMRVGEALQLDIERISHDKGFTMVTVRRKGGKWDTQSLSNVTSYAIERSNGTRTSGPVFTKRNGDRMDRRDAGRIIKKLSCQLGITKRLTPHSFRHTHVTLCLDNGISQRDIMASTGHADSRMVNYYDHRANSPARAATHALTAYIAGAA